MANGFPQNEYNKKPWYNTEIAQFDAIENQLAPYGTKNVDDQHRHRAIKDIYGNEVIKTSSDDIVSMPYQAEGYLYINTDKTISSINQLINTVLSTICFSIFDITEMVYVSEGASGYVISEELDGSSLKNIIARVGIKGESGATGIQIRKNRNGVDIDMLSSNCLITTEYYASNGIIDGTNKTFQTGDMIFIDVESVNNTPPYGLSVTLEITKE